MTITNSGSVALAQDEPAGLPKAEPSWMNMAARLAFVQRPVVGRIGGQPFAPTQFALGPEPGLGGYYLRFWNGASSEVPTQGISIKIYSSPIPVNGSTLTVYNDNCSWQNNIQVILYDPKLPAKIQTLEGNDSCSMRLQFAQPKKGLLAGYITFRANTKPETSLNGYFYIPMAPTP